MSFVASQNVYYCTGIESAATVELGINRWMLDFETGIFVTNLPVGGGPDKDYSSLSNLGCSCSDILTNLNLYDPILYGEMEGQWKFGCSSSVLDDFLALDLEIVPPE